MKLVSCDITCTSTVQLNEIQSESHHASLRLAPFCSPVFTEIGPHTARRVADSQYNCFRRDMRLT